ncbi:MAG: alpha/beta hydrolase [Candidatus Methylomirabilales bacterium]
MSFFPEKGTVFFPDPYLIGTPADVGLAYEEVFFGTRDGVRLHGWYVPRQGSSTTLLWFHGNAGNISHRLENLALVHERVGVNVFIFDYREYGKSEGEISKAGTFLDAFAAFGYLCSRSDLDPSRILLFGRSLGTALATAVAAEQSCLGIILEAAFTSTDDIMRLYFRFLPPLPPGTVKYDTLSLIGKVMAPKLIIHGEHDEIIPVWMGRRLYEAASSPKELYLVPGATHNDTYMAGGQEYFAKLKTFANDLDRRAKK